MQKVQNKSVSATIMSVTFSENLLAIFLPPFDTEKEEPHIIILLRSLILSVLLALPHASQGGDSLVGAMHPG